MKSSVSILRRKPSPRRRFADLQTGGRGKCTGPPGRHPVRTGRVLWLTGNAGAGKTTLALFLKEKEEERVVVLDGNEMRASISTDCGFSFEDRRKHNLRVARLARILAHQGFLVVVAVIAPFARVRGEIDDICHPLWVYVKRGGLEQSNRPYEPPPRPDFLIDVDKLSMGQARQRLYAFVSVHGRKR